jgi:biotin synthase
LLTTGNPDVEADRQLLADAGVQANWQDNARTLVKQTPVSI